MCLVVFGSRRADVHVGEVEARRIDELCREHHLQRTIGAQPTGAGLLCSVGAADADGRIVANRTASPMGLQDAERLLLEDLNAPSTPPPTAVVST